MQKWAIYSFLAIFSCRMVCFGTEDKVTAILSKYPRPIYQDVIVNNKVLINGINLCDKRYDLIKPIFNLFQAPFSVLDLGSAQGYFSFRIAHDGSK
jgi:hypothetical protein